MIKTQTRAGTTITYFVAFPVDFAEELLEPDCSDAWLVFALVGAPGDPTPDDTLVLPTKVCDLRADNELLPPPLRTLVRDTMLVTDGECGVCCLCVCVFVGRRREVLERKRCACRWLSPRT